MKRLLLILIISILYVASVAAQNNITGSIVGKWKPYDIAITIEGIPNAISSAIAIQIKEDPSTECARNSIIEVKKSNTYTLFNACEENGDMNGTWKLSGDKLIISLSKYPNSSETVTIKSLTEELITIDITDKIPSDFEFNGIRLSSAHLILKRM